VVATNHHGSTGIHVVNPLGFDTAGKSPSLLNQRWSGSLTATT
jgi:hypothetical protein